MKFRLISAAPYAFAGVLALLAYVGHASKPFVTEERPDRETLEMANGWHIRYLHGGDSDGVRIVYVHGTPGSADAFDDYVANPVSGTEAVAIDRPGLGYTLPDEPTGDLREQAEFIEPFLVERYGHWPILVGHSLGAPIVCQAAVDYPGRVGGLVLVSGSMDPSLEGVFWYQRLAESGLMPVLLPDNVVNSNRELFDLKESLEGLEPRLAEITCPVVIVHAIDDILVPYSNVAYMEQQLVNAPIEVVSLYSGDHFLPWNREEQVREAIMTLIQGGAPPDPATPG